MTPARKFFIVACFVIVLSGLSPAVLAADVWYTGTVDPGSTNNPFQPTAIAVDGSGLPRIAYTSGSMGLKYAEWNGSGWDITTLSAGSATFPSLVPDAGGRAHISYYRDEWGNDALMYVAQDASGDWQTPEVVDTDGGMLSSIVLDTGGAPHISYASDAIPATLKYAEWNGTAWEIQTVPGSGGVSTPTALALDSSGNPHIAYRDSSTNRLYYASSDGSAWSVSYVAYTNAWGGWPSLALDSADAPHLSYFVGSAPPGSSAVFHATYSGSWTSQTVDTVGLTADLFGGYHTSIALDGSDRPRISYYDGATGDLKYAWHDGAQWQELAVDSTGDAGYGSSLALDSAGYPHIGYYDVTNSALKYAALGPEPVAGFAAAPAGGIAPVTVQFTDNSTGATAWSWDFGDGAVSAQQHPEHTYTAGGLYTVSLTASSIFGSDTATQPDAIAIVQVSNFTANRTIGAVPMAVGFTDTTEGAVTAWNWTFGDGNTSTLQHPVHTYGAAGTYTVSLYTESDAGTSYVAKTDYIDAGRAPAANFTAVPTVGTVPLAVHFTDTSVNATAWDWSFGDGGTSIVPNPGHTYTTPGVYTVILNVSNSYGAATKTGTVDAVQVTDFSANTTFGALPLAVAFTDLTTGQLTGWNWTFGDGSGSTEENPVHTYQSPGVFNVSLTTTSAAGSNTTTKTGYIETGYAPVSGFTANVTAGAVPLGVGFTDLSSYADGWRWDFGDGGFATLQNVSHTYTEPGFYTVSLNTTNSYGDDTLVRNGYITAAPGVTGISPVSAMVNTAAHLNLSGTGFANGMTVSLSRPGLPAINATNVTVTGATALSCTVDLTNASWGLWDVVVTSPAGPSGVLADGFEVIYPVPVLTGIAPASGIQERILDPVNLTGSGFLPGTTVALRKSGESPVIAQNVAVSAEDRIACTLDLAGVAAGVWNVTVTNPDGQSATLSGAFTVIEALRPGGGGGTAEFDFVTNGTVLTSFEGRVYRTTTITSADGVAMLTIPQGTVALDESGDPIREITITAVDEVPETPEGAIFSFAGYAYEITPEGATFDPPITLTFTYSSAMFPDEQKASESIFSIYFYNTGTGAWEEVPSVFDPGIRTVTGTISHFTVFALFAEGTAETAPAAVTTTGATPAATAETAETTEPAEPAETPASPLVFAPVLGLLAFLFFARRH